ncbi:MAG: pyridoxal 5'-phosphate synthase glutaminase subunit PdxT [Actinomycetota bacterium]|jgi:5'-phosphate synthase pdxT subunit|nr:pyridoxal 5'-phosphate synthase glutaminase subunit PdxT [Actinomycetota bacterium]
MRIGVLALQGDFISHLAILDKLAIQSVMVKTPGDLDVDGIIIPGGESTSISMLLQSSGIYEPLRALLHEGLPAFGTCAGMILLANSVVDGREDQMSLDAIDIVVRRNGFGRQMASFETSLTVSTIEDGPMRALFIRAPVVEKVSSEVEVLSSVTYSFADSSDKTVPVICRQNKVIVSSFHPELVGEDRLHKLFLELL